jgi:hypothetical protein
MRKILNSTLYGINTVKTIDDQLNLIDDVIKTAFNLKNVIGTEKIEKFSPSRFENDAFILLDELNKDKWALNVTQIVGEKKIFICKLHNIMHGVIVTVTNRKFSLALSISSLYVAYLNQIEYLENLFKCMEPDLIGDVEILNY